MSDKPLTGEIRFACESGHTQTLHLEQWDRTYAFTLAGLIDGSSVLYLFPPDANSMIGKCGVCGKQIAAKVFENGVEVQPP